MPSEIAFEEIFIVLGVTTMPSFKPVIITTTVPNMKIAKLIANTLLESQLAACIQTEMIQSFYTWQGQNHQDEEVRLTIKTTRCYYKNIEKIIVRLHPYDCPQILMQPVSRGFTPYLRWMKQCLGI